MLDWLVQIPGQTFLVYFIVFSTVVIVTAWKINQKDGTQNKPLPSLTQLDTITIAALRGGWTQVLRTIIFSIYEKKMIDIKETKRWGGFFGTTIEIKSIKSTKVPSTSLEQEIHEYLFVASDPKALFQDTVLKEKIERHIAPSIRELQTSKIMKTDEDIKRTRTIAFVSIALLLLFGGTKLILGFSRGKPISFLVLLLIVSIHNLLKIMSLSNPATTLGKLYLKKMEQKFKWIKGSLTDKKSVEGIDPAFAVALFGASVLGSSAAYTSYNHAFSKSGMSGACGGGCGGGGGGGGCGGGCGGCGG
jgi:uncharacterized protein (TIGR04222 family)